MSLYESVFTKAVSDVIGNDPVLDQFDIFYEASYYGSMQDNYVTGSLLNKVVGSGARLTFTTGSRGRYFSKFYVSSQQPIDSTYGSEEVNKNPSLSFRKVPLKTQVSRSAYRILQCIDENERYYDSCLPDMNAVLKQNGSKIWSIENSVNALSPYVNVATSSVGYMLFDSIEVDRSSDGFTNDPTVFNGWTRSFPYESKYSTVQRLISVDGQLGLGSRSLTLNWNSPKKDDLLLNEVTGSSGFFSLPTTDKTYDPEINSMTSDDISLSNLRSITPKPIKSFIPIVPGLLENNSNANFINGLRQKTLLDGGYGTVAINMGEYANLSLEKETGYSLLLPSDVNLSKKITHADYLSPYGATDPGLEYVTGSMYTSDLVKFLFGFGDLNNVTYGRREYDSTKKRLVYNESFEDYSDGTRSYNIPTYKDEFIELNWQGISYLSDFSRGWRVTTTDGEITPSISSIDRNIYFFKSGSKPDSDLKGIKWLSGSSDFKVLVSSTSKYLNSPYEIPSGALGSGDTSFLHLDITSSYPWSFSYDRAVCAATSDQLTVALTGAPGIPSSVTSCFFPIIYVDQVKGTGGGLVKMETYDFMENGFLTGSVYNKNYPLPPGKWQLFAFYTSGSTTTTNPSFAAINNLKFYTFADLEKTQMIGSNNLPDFSAKLTDRRIDPTFKSTPLYDGPWTVNPTVASLHLSGTSNMYSSYVFGVSPVIRGWKYGLVNGFPQHSKAVFRRGKYGQFRDMLEQRQYTKFVRVNTSPTDFDAVSVEGFNRDLETTLPKQATSIAGQLDAAVEVKFVRKTAVISQRGVGTISTQIVPPYETTSQNLSSEVTSSLPYFDLVPRHRSVEEMRGIVRRSFVDTDSVGASTQQLGLDS